jgi:hypothetical protein
MSQYFYKNNILRRMLMLKNSVNLQDKRLKRSRKEFSATSNSKGERGGVGYGLICSGLDKRRPLRDLTNFGEKALKIDEKEVDMESLQSSLYSDPSSQTSPLTLNIDLTALSAFSPIDDDKQEEAISLSELTVTFSEDFEESTQVNPMNRRPVCKLPSESPSENLSSPSVPEISPSPRIFFTNKRPCVDEGVRRPVAVKSEPRAPIALTFNMSS